MGPQLKDRPRRILRAAPDLALARLTIGRAGGHVHVLDRAEDGRVAALEHGGPTREDRPQQGGEFFGAAVLRIGPDFRLALEIDCWQFALHDKSPEETGSGMGFDAATIWQ